MHDKKAARKPSFSKVWFLAAFLIIAGVIVHWHLNWKRVDTPAYSIHQISSIRNGMIREDVTTYVDEAAFYGDLFEELVRPDLSEKHHPSSSQLMLQARQSLRTRFITDMIAARGAAFEKKERPALHPLADHFIASADFFQWELYSIDSIQEEKDRAEAALTMHHKDLADRLPVRVILKKTDRGTWKVVGLANPRKFYEAAREAVQKRLEVLNEPLAKEIAEAAVLSAPAFSITRRRQPYASCYFLYTPTLRSLSGQVITQMIGQVQVHNREGQLLFSQKFIEAGPLRPGQSRQLRISWPLNEENPEERKLLAADPSTLTLTSSLLRLRFADGSVIQLLESLPNH